MNDMFETILGKLFCIETYTKLAKALCDGGADGFLLESMNCWEEAEIALEGVKEFKKVCICDIFTLVIYWYF